MSVDQLKSKKTKNIIAYKVFTHSEEFENWQRKYGYSIINVMPVPDVWSGTEDHHKEFKGTIKMSIFVTYIVDTIQEGGN